MTGPVAVSQDIDCTCCFPFSDKLRVTHNHASQSSDDKPASSFDPTAIRQFHLFGLVCFDLHPDGIKVIDRLRYGMIPSSAAQQIGVVNTSHAAGSAVLGNIKI
jgi:hypothetical protein